MKVLAVLLSITAVSLASLEPAGYRPPGSSSQQYLPPHLHSLHDHHHHQQQAQVKSAPSSQYLPPTAYNSPSSQYLPPQPSAPASNYLPVTEKPRTTARPLPTPANDYLPPAVIAARSSPPATNYLPPAVIAARSSPPATNYLPPQARAQASIPIVKAAAPASNYLPPTLKSAPTQPPKTEYLPPRPTPPPAPKTNYLPPVQRTTPTPSARISVVTAAPFKLNAPTYTQQQPKFAAATRSASDNGYAYPQPSNDYLPPSDLRTAADEEGYHYGAPTTEPAKYDFAYSVSDEFGNDFGHKETREGAATHGSYSVVLPNGRKQIVTYMADENGFRPRISYEDVATVLGPKAAFTGYDSNANNIGY